MSAGLDSGGRIRPSSPFRPTPPPLASHSQSSTSHARQTAAAGSGRGFYPGFLADNDGGVSYARRSPGSSRSASPESPTTLPYLCGSPEQVSSSSSSSGQAFPTGPMTISPSPIKTGPNGIFPSARQPTKARTLPLSTGSGKAVPKRRPTPLVLGQAKNQVGLDEEVEIPRDNVAIERSSTATSSTFSDDASSLSNELQDLSMLRKSVRQNLLAQPLDSPLAGSDSDRDTGGYPTPEIDLFRLSTASYEGVNTISVQDTIRSFQSSPQILIIDTRPLGSFLDSHFPRSANISIPSLIFKRLRKSPGARSTSWDTLGGFVSTPAGRQVWESLETDQKLDVIIVGMTATDELAKVLYRIMTDLVQNGTVHALQGGWGAVITSPEARDILVAGEMSTKGRPSLATSLPPPKSAPAIDFPPPPPIPPSSPPRGVNHRPSMPSLRAEGPNAGRNLPTLSINGTANGPSARRVPKLSLNLDRPLRSATTGSFPHDQPPRTPGGRPQLLFVDTGAGAAAAKSPRTPGFTINIPKTPSSHGSFQTLCHAQAKVPPSPSSFGDIKHVIGRDEDTLSGASKPPSTPWTSKPTARPNGSRTPSGHLRSDSVDEEEIALATARTGMAPFIVSTILPSFLYLGPEISSQEDVNYLKTLGVKRILNVAIECEDDAGLELKENFKYHRVPMRDIVEESGVAEGMRESCGFLDDARLHSAPTYVHCKAGKSRSVTVVLAYLIHANAWTLKTSYAYVAERRKGISPNIGFVAELMQFEEAELGLKQSGGVHGEGGRKGGAARADEEDGGDGRKNPRYMRESLPPAWSSMDSYPKSPRIDVGVVGDEKDDKEKEDERGKGRRQVGDEREVRKNGQWVHHRRAPVDRTTLQPGRRVSKAGLESLRSLNTTSITSDSYSRERPSPVPSPSLKDGRDRHHAATPAGEGPLRWV